jgi:hypothetical protein
LGGRFDVYKGLPDHQIAKQKCRIVQLIASDAELVGTATILRSVPRIDPVVNSMLISEMSKRGPGRDPLQVEFPVVRPAVVVLVGTAKEAHVHCYTVRQVEDVPRQRHP